MGESGVIDYAKFMVEDIPESMKGEERHFSIEISIVMRKPKGHFSRAPGVVLDILRDFGGGTFFEGQGYWKGVQEPVVYILISTIGKTEDIINLVRRKITSAQLKLRQQEAFVKINGSTFAGNLLDKSVTDNFPKQWEFDSDMKKITANQSRTNEHYKLIYGRVDYDNGDFEGAQKKWRDMIHEFAHFIGDLYKEKGYSNIAVYAESYVTLNGRPSKQFIDPNFNLYKENISLKNKEWIIPSNYDIKKLL